MTVAMSRAVIAAPTVAIMQPYLFPYIGYFQLIAAVDQFVIYDTVKYTKKGWINRNRFLRDGEHVVSCVDHDDATGPLLLTSLSGRLRPLTPRSARTAFFAMPALTLMIVARIHWQALKLAFKRVPFFSKPQPPEHFVTR